MMILISSCSHLKVSNSGCYAFDEIYLTEEENNVLKKNNLNQARRAIAVHNEIYTYMCGGGD